MGRRRKRRRKETTEKTAGLERRAVVDRGFSVRCGGGEGGVRRARAALRYGGKQAMWRINAAKEEQHRNELINHDSFASHTTPTCAHRQQQPQRHGLPSARWPVLGVFRGLGGESRGRKGKGGQTRGSQGGGGGFDASTKKKAPRIETRPQPHAVAPSRQAPTHSLPPP